MTALGTGLEATGTIAPDGLDLVERTVGAMAERARGLGADRIAIACTAVGRDAANAPDLLARIERATGVTPTVLSGEREAALTFQGIVAGGAADELVAADLGGGSLELMGGGSGTLAWATSIPVGVRKLTERFAVADPPDRSGWGRSSTMSRTGSAGRRGPCAGSDRRDRRIGRSAVAAGRIGAPGCGHAGRHRGPAGDPAC